MVFLFTSMIVFMKKYIYLLVLTLLACLVLYRITRPSQRTAINSDFTRKYTVITAKQDTVFSFPYKIDLLAAWRGNIIYYSLADKILGECTTAGTTLHTTQFTPASRVSSIFSISTTPGNIYCFDINSRSVLVTDFSQPLRFKDSLPKETRGAVINPSNGYTLLRYNEDSGRIVVQDSIPGKPAPPVYAMRKLYDNGFSQWGQCFLNEEGTSFIDLPFYHSGILTYHYPAQKISFIETLDKTPLKDITVPAGNGRIISSRAPIVNRKAAAGKQWLYVLSYARAKDDAAQDEIIDVYDLTKGSYVSSFVLPGLPKGSIAAMTIASGKLVLSSQHQILIYSVHENSIH